MSATVATQQDLNKKFGDLKKILKEIKSKDGIDLFSHLQNVFKKLILHYPDHALEKLEEVSYLLKHNDVHKLEDFLKVSDFRNYKDVCCEMNAYIKKMETQFGAKKAAADGEEGGEEEAPEEVPAVGLVPDLLADSLIYQWSGIGFGQQELYRLQKSLKKLAGDSSAAKLRFFGKIRGSDNDYYIAEGEVEGGGEEAAEGDEPPADMEANGTGVNKFTYYVSHSSFDDWKKLPDLQPKDIQASREIKVMFTGDLERTIFTNPFFFGKEKNYLRAQIARISFSTSLCPVGLFRLQEENPRDIEENAPEEGDIVLPTTNQMQDANMWVHNTSNILRNCKTAHVEPEPEEGVEEEEGAAMKRLEASDPYEPRLKSIVSDSKVNVSRNQKIAPWVVKQMGDSSEYRKSGGKTVSNGVVVVRSLQWPGSFNYYYQGRYINIYVGNGHKYEEVNYFPIHPPTVNEDPEEYEIQPEPTPLTEPVVEEKPKEEGEEGAEGEKEEDE